jgi:hypothetical protein
MREPRMIFGFCLLGILAFLSARVALGHVEMQSSYGLDILLGSLSTLTGSFAQWAFSTKSSNSTNSSTDTTAAAAAAATARETTP